MMLVFHNQRGAVKHTAMAICTRNAAAWTETPPLQSKCQLRKRVHLRPARWMLLIEVVVLLWPTYCSAQTVGWAQSNVSDPATLLDLHNALRSRARVPALAWDDSLASSAQVLPQWPKLLSGSGIWVFRSSAPSQSLRRRGAAPV